MELKPCPFCGGEAKFDHDYNGWNWIFCSQCNSSTNARVSAMDDCKPLLVEAWNRRHGTAEIACLTKQRDELVKYAKHLDGCGNGWDCWCGLYKAIASVKGTEK
jgi:Lar family restriction alleviation protein